MFVVGAIPANDNFVLSASDEAELGRDDFEEEPGRAADDGREDDDGLDATNVSTAAFSVALRGTNSSAEPGRQSTSFTISSCNASTENVWCRGRPTAAFRIFSEWIEEAISCRFTILWYKSYWMCQYSIRCDSLRRTNESSTSLSPINFLT